MQIRTIIVDDEPKAIEILERYIEKLPLIRLEKTFRDPLEALDYLTTQPIDLVFLDINMPSLSGIEFSKTVGESAQIIFTTAYPEFAIQGFDLHAKDYLLKPIEFERFEKAVSKITIPNQKPSNFTIDDEILFFKSGTRIYKTNIPDILFFEKDGNYFTIHLKDGKTILIRVNFSDLLDMLPANKFLRVHKSYIVSIKNIDLIENDEIRIDQHRIPIGLNFKSNLDAILPK